MCVTQPKKDGKIECRTTKTQRGSTTSLVLCSMANRNSLYTAPSAYSTYVIRLTWGSFDWGTTTVARRNWFFAQRDPP